MPNIFKDKHIVLGITGSIACYKAVDLASKLVQAGAKVDVVLTRGAQQFISALTVSSITHRHVTTSLFDSNSPTSINHIILAQEADVIIVSPATAHTIAKMALGLADDPLTTTILATTAPIIIAPAMDGHMYDNTITRNNLKKLVSRGFTIVGPESGYLASGFIGKGRLAPTEKILASITNLLTNSNDLKGRTVIVTAGGTKEPIDPVRVITNRSSGKMGYAVANAAHNRGAKVVLITTTDSIPDPLGVDIIKVETTLEMRKAVHKFSKKADVLIMAAAVSDYRPIFSAKQKIKKGGNEGSIKLIKNPDILAEATGNMLIKVGFAAESENIIRNAKKKLLEKGAQLIVANDITAKNTGFNSNNNQVTILDTYGNSEELPILTKYEVADILLDRILPYLH